jgi:glycosyltransferase involved in cell wall biosynthesis
MYQDRRGYSANRLALVGSAERMLAKAFSVNCNSYFMPQAQRAMVYTEHYRDYLVKNRYLPAERVSVVPIMHAVPTSQPPRRYPKRVGFVARDFDDKGGAVVVRAFAEVRRLRPDAELWIVGCPRKLPEDELERSGITWLSTVPRERLLNEIMPSFDVFAYPTPHDCFSYVTLEAMSCGVAIATSDYVSMPEAVDFGRAGLISPVGDAAKLAENILTLLEPETNYRYRVAARKRFEEHFSWDAVAPKLLAAYDSAIESFHGAAALAGSR